MFAEHQPLIAADACASPEGLARAAVFVFGTIRQPFARACPRIARFGTGASGISAIRARAREFVRDAPKHYARLEGCRTPTAALEYLAGNVPGLALAKAGFLVQMLRGDIGCIDTVNAALYRVPYAERFGRYKQRSAYGRARALLAYVALCDKLGGSARLWDTWCEHVGSRGSWHGAEHVSRTHVTTIRAVRV
jgi:hypothetical protein